MDSTKHILRVDLTYGAEDKRSSTVEGVDVWIPVYVPELKLAVRAPIRDERHRKHTKI
jgi:hypothetical protein